MEKGTIFGLVIVLLFCVFYLQKIKEPVNEEIKENNLQKILNIFLSPIYAIIFCHIERLIIFPKISYLNFMFHVILGVIFGIIFCVLFFVFNVFIENNTKI